MPGENISAAQEEFSKMLKAAQETFKEIDKVSADSNALKIALHKTYEAQLIDLLKGFGTEAGKQLAALTKETEVYARQFGEAQKKVEQATIATGNDFVMVTDKYKEAIIEQIEAQKQYENGLAGIKAATEAYLQAEKSLEEAVRKSVVLREQAKEQAKKDAELEKKAQDLRKASIAGYTTYIDALKKGAGDTPIIKNLGQSIYSLSAAFKFFGLTSFKGIAENIAKLTETIGPVTSIFMRLGSSIGAALLAAFQAVQRNLQFISSLAQTTSLTTKGLTDTSAALTEQLRGSIGVMDTTTFGINNLTTTLKKVITAIPLTGDVINNVGAVVTSNIQYLARGFVTLGFSASDALSNVENLAEKGIVEFTNRLTTGVSKSIQSLLGFINELRNFGINTASALNFVKESYPAYQKLGLSISDFSKGFGYLGKILGEIREKGKDAFSLFLKSSEGMLSTMKLIASEGDKLTGMTLVGYRMIAGVGPTNVFSNVMDLVKNPMSTMQKFSLQASTMFNLLGKDINTFMTYTYSKSDAMAKIFSEIWENARENTDTFTKNLQALGRGETIKGLTINQELVRLAQSQLDPLSLMVRYLEQIVYWLESKGSWLVRIAMKAV